eukprot:TRINITY_DN3636_c0_g1_i1.p1 TRINITY_DN3636_c0_g1~~TRINITY_DN3636_c0_g1_i1.p1  ORF type:complete len:744 (-),score=197.35 TRINITY_DN3636_c0_g1_i1:118-2295(-)
MEKKRFDKRRITAGINRVKERMGMQDSVEKTPITAGLVDSIERLTTNAQIFTDLQKSLTKYAQATQVMINRSVTLQQDMMKFANSSAFSDETIALLILSSSVIHEVNDSSTSLLSDLETNVLRSLQSYRLSEHKNADIQQQKYTDIRIDLDNATQALANKEKDKRVKDEDYSREEHYANAFDAHKRIGPATVDVINETVEVTQFVMQEALLKMYESHCDYAKQLETTLASYSSKIGNFQASLDNNKATARSQRGPLGSYLFRLENGNSPKVTYFTKSLEDLVEREGEDIPYMLSQSLAFFYQDSMERVGLFRVSGRKLLVDMVRHSIDVSCIVDLHPDTFKGTWDPSESSDIYGSVFKLWLRLLPEPLITFDCYDSLLAIFANTALSSEEKKKAVRGALESMPITHTRCVAYLLGFLSKVAEKEAVNKMGVANLVTVMGPNIFYAKPADELKLPDFKKEGEVVQYLIENVQDLLPSFDPPAFIPVSEQRVPEGAGLLVAEDDAEKLRKASKKEKNKKISRKIKFGGGKDKKKKEKEAAPPTTTHISSTSPRSVSPSPRRDGEPGDSPEASPTGTPPATDDAPESATAFTVSSPATKAPVPTPVPKVKKLPIPPRSGKRAVSPRGPADDEKEEDGGLKKSPKAHEAAPLPAVTPVAEPVEIASEEKVASPRQKKSKRRHRKHTKEADDEPERVPEPQVAKVDEAPTVSKKVKPVISAEESLDDDVD